MIWIHPDPRLRQKLAQPLRFTAERTLTHDAKALVFPGATPEHPNGAPGPADTATLFVPRGDDGELDHGKTRVIDYQPGRASQ